jgi:hypothetical protein
VKRLDLASLYTREEAHDIFSPESTFTPQSGTWGIHGAVQIPDRPGDYVFFVTYGQSQAEHDFDESVTDEGILTWQSQPSQELNEKRILEWISHDELKNTVHLFLRTKKNTPYTYLGTLKYLTHDSEREKPVYFKWQLLDWEQLHQLETSENLDLKPRSEAKSGSEATPAQARNTLIEAARPEPLRGPELARPRSFRQRQNPDYSERESKNRELGLAGELLAIAHERKRLSESSTPELAEKVLHVSVVEGDGAGHDIRSFQDSGAPLFIEVKTTRGGPETPFYLSAGELEFARVQQNSYHLFRVYDFDPETSSGMFFRVEGDPSIAFDLIPQTYKVFNRSNSK